MMKLNKTIAALGVALTISSLPAKAQAQTCWDTAQRKHGVSAWLLMAYASVESDFKNGAINRNRNGSTDVGMMQINTIHAKNAAKYGYSMNDLRYNPCAAIDYAARLAKPGLSKWGFNAWGVGAYHSRTPHLQVKYGNKVLSRMRYLIAKYGNNRAAFSFHNARSRVSAPSSAATHTGLVKVAYRVHEPTVKTSLLNDYKAIKVKKKRKFKSNKKKLNRNRMRFIKPVLPQKHHYKNFQRQARHKKPTVLAAPTGISKITRSKIEQNISSKNKVKS